MYDKDVGLSVQEFLISFRESHRKPPQQGLLSITSHNGWMLKRLDAAGNDEIVFDLPAVEAWKKLEELDAARQVWDSALMEQIAVTE